MKAALQVRQLVKRFGGLVAKTVGKTVAKTGS